MKRISALAIAGLLAVSMSAFADNTSKPAEGKSCDKMSAAECQKKDPNCTKKCTSETHTCPTHANNSCKKATARK
ncbi:MAG TPA: hypothetical protein VGJ81_20590 [Thermoanaerobaculia bacterium]|jgi:hypothetical protein